MGKLLHIVGCNHVLSIRKGSEKGQAKKTLNRKGSYIF